MFRAMFEMSSVVMPLFKQTMGLSLESGGFSNATGAEQVLPGQVVLAVIAGYAASVIALVLLMATTFRTVNQMSALQNVGAMVFGGLGGALVPFEQRPGFAQAIAPVTPAYSGPTKPRSSSPHLIIRVGPRAVGPVGYGDIMSERDTP